MTGWEARLARTRAELEALRPAWTAVADGGGADSVFSTPEWQLAWVDALGDAVVPVIASVHDATGALVALLPLALRSRGSVLRRTTVIELAGETIACGDHLGLVALPANRPAAWRAITAAVVECAATADVVRFASMDDGAMHEAVVQFATARGWRHTLRRSDVAPRLALTGGAASFDASLSARYRKRVHGYERAFRAAYPSAEYRTHDDAASRRAAMDALYALHAARWPGGGVLGDAVMRRFLENFSQAAAGRGWLRVHEIKLDGRVIAALLAVHWRGTASYFQSGWDPAFAKSNVAELLVVYAIREAAREGCHAFDFLRGAEPYKARFPVTAPALHTDEWARTARGRNVAAVDALLDAVGRSARRYRTRAQRLLTGRGR